MYVVIEDDVTVTIIQVKSIEDARNFAKASGLDDKTFREATEYDLLDYRTKGGIVKNLLGN